jgi:hypothetical protein
MTEVELKEKVTLDGAETAASKLAMLGRAAGGVAQKFQSIVSVASAIGGLAGVFQVVQTIQEVDRLYGAIARVSDITGIAAGNAHALFDMFELSGIGMEGAESIITNLTRSGQRLAQQMAMGGASGDKMVQIMRRLGVSVKAGPEEKIFAMSKAAEAGKLSILDMMQAFNIPRGQAAEMMSMLKKGPEELKKIQKDVLGSAAVIDERALAAHKKMLAARRELADAWGDLVNTLYKTLIPGVTAVVTQIKSEFEELQPAAEAVGKILSDHMHVVVALAKTYLALMIAAKAANMFSGTEMGIGGRIKQVAGGANRMMAGKAAAAGGMDFFAAKAANPGIGMFGTAGGPIVRIISSLAGRLGLIGVVVTAVVGAFMLLKNNVGGLGTIFKSLFGGIASTFKSVFEKIIAVAELLVPVVKAIAAVLGGALLGALYVVGLGLKVVAFLLDTAMSMIIAVINGVIFLLNQIPGVSIDMIDLAKKKAEESEVKTPDKKAETYQDFRGSKFEITNNFPQGIDGGRVAVAFGDELAKLGERRLDSGLRPLYAFR